MVEIKKYYNQYFDVYIESEEHGDMVMLEDHKAFVKEAMQQAFRDGFKAGQNIYITKMTDEDRII